MPSPRRSQRFSSSSMSASSPTVSASKKRKRVTSESFTRSHYCAAINCRNNRVDNKALSFFRFPKDPERCSEWIQYSKRAELKGFSPEYCHKNLLFCSNHFEVHMFRTNTEKPKSRLHHGAVPHLFDVPDGLKTHKKGRRKLMYDNAEKEEISVPVVATASSDVSDLGERNQCATPALTSRIDKAASDSLGLSSPPHLQVSTPILTVSTGASVQQSIRQCLVATPVSATFVPTETVTAEEEDATNVRETEVALAQNQKMDLSGTPCLNRGPYKIKSTPRRERLRKCLQKLHAKVKKQNREIRRLQKDLNHTKSLEGLIESTRSFLTEDEHRLVEAQMRLSVGKKKTYTEEFKEFAISIYDKRPSCYRFLKTRLQLPAKSTINLWLSQLRFQEGLCPNLLKMLSMRVGRLKNIDRICVLIGDEITLKESLDYSPTDDKVYGFDNEDKICLKAANVFMAAGLKSRWKQAVSYKFVPRCLPANDLVVCLRKTLDELTRVGLRVKVFSSDQGPNYSSALVVLGVSKQRPYFEHGQERIYCIADPPHVLKSTRNCLLNHIVESSLGTAKWSVIVALYDLDRKQQIRLCPKLRDAHFNMKPLGAKMKVRYASQVVMCILCQQSDLLLDIFGSCFRC